MTYIVKAHSKSYQPDGPNADRGSVRNVNKKLLYYKHNSHTNMPPCSKNVLFPKKKFTKQKYHINVSNNFYARSKFFPHSFVLFRLNLHDKNNLHKLVLFIIIRYLIKFFFVY